MKTGKERKFMKVNLNKFDSSLVYILWYNKVIKTTATATREPVATWGLAHGVPDKSTNFDWH